MEYIFKNKSKTKDEARTSPTFEDMSSLKVLSSATLEEIAGASPADHIPMWSAAHPPRAWDSADNEILTILRKFISLWCSTSHEVELPKIVPPKRGSLCREKMGFKACAAAKELLSLREVTCVQQSIEYATLNMPASQATSSEQETLPHNDHILCFLWQLI